MSMSQLCVIHQHKQSSPECIFCLQKDLFSADHSFFTYMEVWLKLEVDTWSMIGAEKEYHLGKVAVSIHDI